VQICKKYAVHRFKIHLHEGITQGENNQKTLSSHESQRFFHFFTTTFEKTYFFGKKHVCRLSFATFAGYVTGYVCQLEEGLRQWVTLGLPWVQ